MNTVNPLPQLITFDGEARSGKGTIVQGTKDYLHDEKGRKVMLIDGGQVFRVLVIAVTRAGIDPANAEAVDAFLADDAAAETAVKLVRQVYHMSKEERDGLLYTNEVGKNSAKIGSRPLSQSFKDELLKKWLRDAREEGYEVVLLDGRALEEVGIMLQNEGLCDFILGYYFTCDHVVGARRTLGYAEMSYDSLTDTARQEVNQLVSQIKERNAADAQRPVQPIVRPKSKANVLPSINVEPKSGSRQILLIDTSTELTREAMIRPVAVYTSNYLDVA
jgi:cytidylate kinase